MNSFEHVHAFQIELEFGSVGFLENTGHRLPAEKPLGARERTNNKLDPHEMLMLGFEPSSCIGGRRVLFLPHHPRPPRLITQSHEHIASYDLYFS